jgi:hypothetical protein
MKSKMVLGEVVQNKERKFGSQTEYYPCEIKQEDESVYALFTKDQVDEAIERANRNVEDIPEKTFWENVFEK